MWSVHMGSPLRGPPQRLIRPRRRRCLAHRYPSAGLIDFCGNRLLLLPPPPETAGSLETMWRLRDRRDLSHRHPISLLVRAELKY